MGANPPAEHCQGSRNVCKADRERSLRDHIQQDRQFKTRSPAAVNSGGHRPLGWRNSKHTRQACTLLNSLRPFHTPRSDLKILAQPHHGHTRSMVLHLHLFAVAVCACDMSQGAACMKATQPLLPAATCCSIPHGTVCGGWEPPNNGTCLASAAGALRGTLCSGPACPWLCTVWCSTGCSWLCSSTCGTWSQGSTT